MRTQIITALTVVLLSACQDQQVQWQFKETIDLGEVRPIGIVKVNNYFWTSDAGNNRVLKLDKKGNITEEYTGFQRPMHLSYHNGKLYIPEYLTDTIQILNEGAISSLPLLKKPDAPAAIDIKDNKMAVADFYNHRIILQQGDSAKSIGQKGHDDGELHYPTDVETFHNLLYVADAYNNRVQVFDLQGHYVKMLGWKDSIQVASGLDVRNDYVAVADQENNRALIYDHEGKLLQTLHKTIEYPADVILQGRELYVVNFQSKSISINKDHNISYVLTF